jgi:hypothetical protein
MLFETVLEYNVLLIIGSGGLFAGTGLFFRSGPSASTDRDNLVYADGFQGASIATLFVVAVMVYYIGDPRAVSVLKEQANIISTFSLLGCIQFADRFRRSLKQ